MVNKELIPRTDKEVKVPIITVVVNGRRVQCLVDTAARRTVVKSGVLDSQTGIDEWKYKLTDFNGRVIPILGTQNVRITVATDAHDSAVLHQQHSSPYHLLIGTDLLSKLNAKIDFNNRILSLNIKKQEVPHTLK